MSYHVSLSFLPSVALTQDRRIVLFPRSVAFRFLQHKIFNSSCISVEAQEMSNHADIGQVRNCVVLCQCRASVVVICSVVYRAALLLVACNTCCVLVKLCAQTYNLCKRSWRSPQNLVLIIFIYFITSIFSLPFCFVISLVSIPHLPLNRYLLMLFLTLLLR